MPTTKTIANELQTVHERYILAALEDNETQRTPDEFLMMFGDALMCCFIRKVTEEFALEITTAVFQAIQTLMRGHTAYMMLSALKKIDPKRDPGELLTAFDAINDEFVAQKTDIAKHFALLAECRPPGDTVS